MARSGVSASAVGQHIDCPAEVWNSISIHLRPHEFLQLCGVATGFFDEHGQRALWREFCIADGFAWVAESSIAEIGEESPSRGPQAPSGCRRVSPRTGRQHGLASGPEINWRRCFQANALANRQIGRLFARVRIREVELRVPVSAGAGGDSRVSKEHEWLNEHGWQHPSVLKRAVQKLLDPSPMPFRFRELIAGRPGLLIKRARCSVGEGPASAIVECPMSWSQTDGTLWQLPPHREPQEERVNGRSEVWPKSGDLVPGPYPWSCRGWLVEVVAKRPRVRQTQCSRGIDSIPIEDMTTVRRWLEVGRQSRSRNLTLGDLCLELTLLLPALGFHGDCDVLPESIWRPGCPVQCPCFQLQLHEDLFWTQGERLHLREVVLPKGGKVILFSRDTARPPKACAPQGAKTPFRSCSSSILGVLPAMQKTFTSNSTTVTTTSCSTVAETCGRTIDASPPRERTDTSSGDVVPHSKRLLLSSSGVRQLEFHPSRPGTMMVGRKDGVIAILDHEKDMQTHSMDIGVNPVLGIAWLHTHPEWAVVGTAHSGTTCMVRYDENKPGCMEQVRLESFAKLSSLSVNCTDDLFMASGFCHDVALYDTATGRRLRMLYGLHQHFINISRFSNTSPHVFATASFDCSCKVWDLREPMTGCHPVSTFTTDTLNVMCCFSPDDKHILCSGVGVALQQFSLSHRAPDEPVVRRFSVPTVNASTNYRRSLYLADGATIATVSTQESVLRLYKTEVPGRATGLIDFRGMLSRRCGCSAEGLQAEEYVQSVRSHPSDPSVLAALLSTSDPHPESFVSMVNLGA